jgi:hypothetical protein
MRLYYTANTNNVKQSVLVTIFFFDTKNVLTTKNPQSENPGQLWPGVIKMGVHGPRSRRLRTNVVRLDCPDQSEQDNDDRTRCSSAVGRGRGAVTVTVTVTVTVLTA